MTCDEHWKRLEPHFAYDLSGGGTPPSGGDGPKPQTPEPGSGEDEPASDHGGGDKAADDDEEDGD